MDAEVDDAVQSSGAVAQNERIGGKFNADRDDGSSGC